MKFSVVLPIHNEEELLPLSLPSVYNLDPEEVILLFDRCNDGSFELAHKIAEACSSVDKTKFIKVNQPSDWKWRIGFLRRLGYRLAKNNIILTTDADMVLDVDIRRHLKLMSQHALVTFEYISYPISVRNLLKRLCEKILPFSWLSGCYFFKKNAWQETEDLELVKKIGQGEDTNLHLSILTKYTSTAILTKTFHLRTLHATSYERGRTHCKMKRSFLLTTLRAIALFEPSLIIGYLHEKWRTPKIRYTVLDKVNQCPRCKRYNHIEDAVILQIFGRIHWKCTFCGYRFSSREKVVVVN